jgi:hypothetical protein
MKWGKVFKTLLSYGPEVVKVILRIKKEKQ